MAHEITSTDTTATFVGKAGKKAGAWHGLDKPFTDHIDDMEKAMDFVGAGWNVFTRPTFTKIPFSVDGKTEIRDVEIPDLNAIVRGDNGAILGNCGNQWKPLQNREAFNWFQPFIDQKLCKLETCGSLRGGAIVWVLAQVCNSEGDIVPGDSYTNRVLLTNTHDGKTAIRVGFTPVRVVCMNTVRAAFNASASKLIRVRHSQHVKTNVENIRQVMDVANMEFRATLDELKILTCKQINKADLRKYVKLTLGKLANKTDKEIAEMVESDAKMSTRFSGLVEKALGYIETSPGADMAKGTLYQAAQGLNYYVNYEIGHDKPEKRLENLWFNNRAGLPFEIALSLAT